MSWEPASEAEVAMAAAADRGDATAFFRAVLGSPLYLPAVGADLVDGRARELFSVEVDRRRYLLVFTSPVRASGVSGADTAVVTDYRELLEHWPDPAWRLALNPGTPIDALVTPDAMIRAALGEVTVPAAGHLGEVLAGQDSRGHGVGRPANAVEEGIAVALAEDDPDLLLDVLVTASVLVPTTVPTEPSALDRPDFPWRRVADTIAVFTSPERLADALPASMPAVAAELLDVVGVWPPRTWLTLNPGTSLEVRIAPDRVVELLDWAAGLADRYDVATPDRPDPEVPPISG